MNNKILIDAAKENFVKEYKGSLEQYAIDNFIAGYNFHSTGKEKGLKWVKVKDGTPKQAGVWYFCKVLNKVTGIKEKMIVYMTNLYFDVDMSVFEVLEWLDEGE